MSNLTSLLTSLSDVFIAAALLGTSVLIVFLGRKWLASLDGEKGPEKQFFIHSDGNGYSRLNRHHRKRGMRGDGSY